MTSVNRDHPTAAELKAYGLGKLPGDTADAVGLHLERCEECLRAVAEASGDSFLVRFREAQRGGARALARPVPAAAPVVPPELTAAGVYAEVELLGEGGMGVVYRARNTLMNRLEVLKVVNTRLLSRPGAAERFLREIRSAAKLNHPNVVAAFAARHMGELLVFSMEYVDGVDLGKLIRRDGPLAPALACQYVQQAASGLQHAFESGMIHRDVKPANLILQVDAARNRSLVKVLDFGLAKLTREQPFDAGLTGEGRMLGTPDYIAPEQIVDAQSADVRADVYSLGCTLHYLITGAPPFRARSLHDLLRMHQEAEPPLLHTLRAEVPAGLSAVVARMMAKAPAARPQSPAEVMAALAPFTRPAAVRRPPPPVSTQPSTRSTAQAARETLVDAPSTPAPAPVNPRATRRLRPAPVVWVAAAAGLAATVLLALAVRGAFNRTPRPQPAGPEAPEVAQDAPTRAGPPVEKPAPSTDLVIDLGAGEKVRLVRIDPVAQADRGVFRMGTSEADRATIKTRWPDPPDDDPDHECRLTKPYYLGKHEVTIGQYRAFTAATGRKTGGGGFGWDTVRHRWAYGASYDWLNPGFPQEDDHPVTMVDWNDAVAFCEWAEGLARAQHPGKADALRVRLPTEAEWEYGCRAGSKTMFCFGDDVEGLVNYGNVPDATSHTLLRTGGIRGDDGHVFTAPVGKFRPNAFGLHDMHGNVWEWCSDWYDPGAYTTTPRTDPTGPESGDKRSYRSSSWYWHAYASRSAGRSARPPNARLCDLGFRIAASGGG